jgi:uncharacterized protein
MEAETRNLELSLPMKFQPDSTDGINAISRFDGQRLWVGARVFDRSVLVPWQGALLTWPVSAPAGLAPAHFEPIVAMRPELVIFGSGPKLVFVKPGAYRPLIDARIGFETMDTAAACRTYNVLASEGRAVVAALLLGGLGAMGELPVNL